MSAQKEFLEDLQDANDRGIGKLRDADISEDSSRAKALQVRQQMSQQLLSIANDQPQRMLSLYQ
jgi:flagellin